MAFSGLTCIGPYDERSQIRSAEVVFILRDWIKQVPPNSPEGLA